MEKDSLDKGNRVSKDMEAGKSTDCSGNSKASLHCWIQQDVARDLAGEEAGRGKA